MFYKILYIILYIILHYFYYDIIYTVVVDDDDGDDDDDDDGNELVHSLFYGVSTRREWSHQVIQHTPTDRGPGKQW